MMFIEGFPLTTTRPSDETAEAPNPSVPSTKISLLIVTATCCGVFDPTAKITSSFTIASKSLAPKEFAIKDSK